MASMLPPLNFVGSDRCCAVHIETAAMNISDVVIIALMLMYVVVKSLRRYERVNKDIYNIFRLFSLSTKEGTG